jgi:K+-sensing histidine kinase KdpD
MKKQTSLFFYVLGIYVVIQFLWWGYHLIQLNTELSSLKNVDNTKVPMILGEGMVFLLILVVGLWRIQVSIKKDQQLSNRQHNFLLSVTHELKTPLASTKLFLQTLLKRDFEKEKRDEIIQKAILENKRLEGIVESILTATRIENGSFVPHKEFIHLEELMTEIAHEFNDKIGKEWIVLEMETKVSVETDVFMLRTIFVNLIENALKYAKESDKLILFLQKHEQNIKFGTKDFGVGIPKEQQQEIFKKFVRIENEETRSQKGTGLGLFIAAEFSRLLGGKINYLPNKPTGSIFEITLYA